MLIDIHAHSLGGDFVNRDEIVLKVIERFNIDKIYISNLCAAIPTKDEVAFVNEQTAQLVKKAPDRIGGYVYISPEHDNAVENVGVDRILFGTDCPINCTASLGQLDEIELSEEDKDKIRYKNALKIFDRSFRL